MSKTTVFVSPGDGQDLAELARALIDLADHPHDVVWSTRENAFEVPEELAQEYAQRVGGSPEPARVVDAEGKRTRAAADPPRERTARPRKATAKKPAKAAAKAAPKADALPTPTQPEEPAESGTPAQTPADLTADAGDAQEVATNG